MGKTVLVTGGAGFIGSNIVEELLNRGYNVIVIDNLSLGKTKNIKHLLENNADKIRFIEGDVRDIKILSDLADEIDFIIHEAAASSLPMFVPDPREGVKVNVLGFLNILEIARTHDNIRRIVYATTSSLYGALEPPHREDMPVIPRTFYEYSMYAREHAARIYYDLYNVEAVGVRYFSIYGPHEEHKGKFANIVTQFMWMLMRGEMPVIYGDGTQTRDFTFVKDAARATILAMEKPDLGADIFNVGTGRETTFNDVIQLIGRLIGIPVKPKYVKNPIKNYVYRTQADTTKAEKILGFRAKVSLEEGMKKTYEYYKKKFEQ
ncbi:MAG: SDR family NAD(P)-dependent oxidoreductase [Candidatus Njordarchaeum guaymaensis]